MENKRWILISANQYIINEPEFFGTYDDAHKEMKKQYEIYSDRCCGELNDDNAWCMLNKDCYYNWRIFYIE